MPRKAKTPKPLAEVIMVDFPIVIERLEEMLRVKGAVPTENQGEHIRDKTEAEMIAFVNGYAACLERIMCEFNCYVGFQYYGPQTAHADGIKSRHVITKASTDFAEWRRLYYTNGIAGEN